MSAFDRVSAYAAKKTASSASAKAQASGSKIGQRTVDIFRSCVEEAKAGGAPVQDTPKAAVAKPVAVKPAAASHKRENASDIPLAVRDEAKAIGIYCPESFDTGIPVPVTTKIVDVRAKVLSLMEPGQSFEIADSERRGWDKAKERLNDTTRSFRTSKKKKGECRVFCLPKK